MRARIEAGFSALAVGPEVRAAAARALCEWLAAEAFAAYRPQLQRLIEAERWAFLLDSFYRTIPFGTGGRRGPVGIGTNRINPHTVATSVQGHVEYLRAKFGTGDLRVVVAFDSRVFRDLRGLYDRSLPNPLLGLRSRDFARLAAEVYAGNGIEVITVPDNGFFLSTTELSFAIRYLGAAGGLNISASHNHPDDNGAKFYTESGGQPVPPEDERMAEAVDAVAEVRSMPFDDAVRQGRVRWWDAVGHEAYLRENLERSVDPAARHASVVYSPLHGTGRQTVYEVLQRAGFEVALVPSQAEPDGEFPNVPFRIPNPEVPEAMEAAASLARERGADAAMASDPDADRIGLAVPTAGGSRFLTGNEIAALLAAYIIETRAERGLLPARAFVVKTAVTTELIAEIARQNGVAVIGDLLVGFKYVARVLDAIAAEGRYGAVVATPADFLLAAEESHGILITPALRDKDAAGAALLLAELIASLKRQGKTLLDYLDEVHDRYGFFATMGYSLVMEGVLGLQRIEQMMAELRRQPPAHLLGRRLARVTDYWDEARFGPVLSATDRASRNVVALRYEPDLKVTARPSGTEPKLKIYVESGTRGGREARRVAQQRVSEATVAFAEHLLGFLGLRLSRPALRLSQLVSVENRLDFDCRFVPELRARLVAGTASAEWIEERLRGYGRDPRRLVAPGIAALLDDPAFRPHGAELRRLFLLEGEAEVPA